MDENRVFLSSLDAEVLKAELLEFFERQEDDNLLDEFAEFIREDFSYGDV